MQTRIDTLLAKHSPAETLRLLEEEMNARTRKLEGILDCYLSKTPLSENEKKSFKQLTRYWLDPTSQFTHHKSEAAPYVGPQKQITFW